MYKKYFLFLAIVLLPVLCFCTTITVGAFQCDFADIQDAIDYSITGDLIRIQAGAYDPFVVCNKGITIEAMNSGTVYVQSNTSGENCIETYSLGVNNTVILRGLVVEHLNDIFGRGIYCSNYGPTYIDSCLIHNNRYPWGAGIFCESEHQELIISNCVIEDNVASNYGGGIYTYGTPYTITSSKIRNNYGAWRGGEICTHLNNGETLELENVEITGNETDYYYRMGAGIYIVLNTSGECNINNCTIADNSPGYYGGIKTENNGGTLDLNVSHSIIWGNSGTPQIPSGYDFTYCCTEDSYTGTGNITSDPQFTDTSTGDYTLDWNSSCIDAGDPNEDLDSDGTVCDIGAYTAEEHDNWEFDETVNGYLEVVWRGFPRLDTSSNNTGQFIEATDMFDKFEYPDNPDQIKVYFQQSIYPDLWGHWDYDDYYYDWDYDPCNDLVNSKRGFKMEVWEQPADVSLLRVFGEKIDPSTSITVDVSDSENWVSYFLDDTQYANSALDSSTLLKLKKVQTENWTAIKVKGTWAWPAYATLSYGDCVVLVDNDELTNFSFQWQDATRDQVEPYERPEPTQFSYSEDLEYLPIYMEFGEEVPLEVGVYVDNVCKGAEVVNADSLFHLRAYVLDEEPGYELEFVFYNGRSDKKVMDYRITDQSGFINNPKLVTGNLGEYAFIKFGDPLTDQVPDLEVEMQTYPNPFNPTITISFQPAECGSVDMEIYNVKGQKVKTLLDNQYCKQGERISKIWEGYNETGEHVSDGIYFVKIRSTSGIQTKKIMLLK